MSARFYEALEKSSQKELRQTARKHLGASQIGARCARQTWYSFRWHLQVPVEGRMLRLWERGHEEEFRFSRWLRAMGIEVRDYKRRLCYKTSGDIYSRVEWDNDFKRNGWEDVSQSRAHIERATDRGEGPKQFSFQAHDGHYRGSSDGAVDQTVAEWFPKVAGKGWGLLEEKTHNERSFADLKKKGVIASKPEHHIQMQQYMHHLGHKWSLYLAVNKNNDEIYAEVIMYLPEAALPFIDRAEKIITARTPPKRMTEDPSWFECRWCDYQDICHFAEPPQKNCRSCAYSVAAPDQEWICNKFHSILPEDFIRVSGQKCAHWEQAQ